MQNTPKIPPNFLFLKFLTDEFCRISTHDLRQSPSYKWFPDYSRLYLALNGRTNYWNKYSYNRPVKYRELCWYFALMTYHGVWGRGRGWRRGCWCYPWLGPSWPRWSSTSSDGGQRHTSGIEMTGEPGHWDCNVAILRERRDTEMLYIWE